MKWTTAILTLLLVQTGLLPAQTPSIVPIKRYPVKTINFENGLLNNATTDIITDYSGFTWLSTVTGLQRFNGYMLETIRPVVGKEVININYPVYFFSLHDGSIWISFKEGILGYNPARSSFYKAVSYPSSNHSYFSIVPMLETKEGVWCMTEKGIVLYSKAGLPVKAYSFLSPLLAHNILAGQQLLLLHSIAVTDRYIFINNPADNNILFIDTKDKSAKVLSYGKKIYNITCDSDHLYLLADNKLLSVDIHTGSIIKSIDTKKLTNENVLRGSLWFNGSDQLLTSINNHLYLLDAATLHPIEITNFEKSPVVQTGFILRIYTDDFHRIWLLSNNDVKRIQDFDIPFAHYRYQNEKNNFVKAIYLDEQKQLVIAGCFNGGIQIYDTVTNALWKRSLITSAAKNIISITKLKTDLYLLITLERGWQLLDLSTNHVKPFPLPAVFKQMLQPTKVNFANNVQRINDTVIMIATANNVFRCVFYGAHLKAVEPLLYTDMNNSITCFQLTKNNTVWIGSAKGLVYRLDKTGELRAIEMPGNFVVRTIAEDAKDDVWIGTDKGLNIYNNNGNLVKHISVEDGLFNDCIYSILPDTGHAVFCGTNLGLSYISLDGTIKNFTREMGLQENEFNTNAAFKASNGRLFFGGINGITSFYPSALSPINDSPFLHIIRLVVSDSLLSQSAGNWIHDTLKLSYRQNRLRLDLAALGLLNTNEYVYKYRMQGFEDEWQSTSAPTGINYTLQPGTYTLQVKYYPTFSSGSVSTKQFVIVIDPPWWQTWWFRVIAVFVMVAIIVFIVQQYNAAKYSKKILALQIQHSVQTEKERISRELHDDLGTKVNILSYNASLLNDLQSATDFKVIGERIRSSSMEMLQSLRETVWTLKQETITTEDVWTRFKNFAAKLHASGDSLIQIKIEEEAGSDKNLNYNKALNILRILQEAVNNAVKHADCTVIKCSKKYEGNSVAYSICDNGKGFDLKVVKEIGEGNGLQNMQQRAKESELDLKIVTAISSGTYVSVKV